MLSQRDRATTELDRIAPSRREACAGRPTGRQTWRDLLFLHWEGPVERLRALVPAPLAIDVYEGRAYVGLVPFVMHDVHLGPLTVGDFPEINLRTYVHADGVPGVWFFSLDARSAFTVWGARTFFRLPYFRARAECARTEQVWDYRSQRKGSLDAALDVQWSTDEKPVHMAEAGTLEHFLTERYSLYGPTRTQGVYRLRVHHAPWPLQRARLGRLSTTIPAAAGLRVCEPIDLVLASAEGVVVETFSKERLPGAGRK